MEHDEKPLPIDIRLLGALAEKVIPFFIFCLWGCLCVCARDAYVFFSTRFSFELFNPVMLDVFLTLLYFFHTMTLSYDQCRAFAKALHYKEMEFEGARSSKMDANPVSVVEALIHINNQLHQHEVLKQNDCS